MDYKKKVFDVLLSFKCITQINQQKVLARLCRVCNCEGEGGEEVCEGVRNE